MYAVLAAGLAAGHIPLHVSDPSLHEAEDVLVSIHSATAELRPASAPPSPLVETVCREGCFEETVSSTDGERVPHVVSRDPVLTLRVGELLSVEQRQVERRSAGHLYVVLLELSPEADARLERVSNPLLTGVAYHAGSVVGSAPLVSVHRRLPLGYYADADSARAALRIFPEVLLRGPSLD
ncbi:MAG: hypothetical protein NXI30_01410 [bacterium]|nr:hypothetical protein [bacterium]